MSSPEMRKRFRGLLPAGTVAHAQRDGDDRAVRGHRVPRGSVVGSSPLGDTRDWRRHSCLPRAEIRLDDAESRLCAYAES